ncbi:MAG TPA: YXWGXW repeat-containing protein [Micropepsaceae bacterium]|nr:YXWGXW repeat-containing protein [Micropepsaceae bacterium]
MDRTKAQFIAALLLILPMPALPGILSPAEAAIAVNLTVGIAPPPLRTYAQPPIPGPGYLWMPGYWAWNGAGYYWVPGTWILPPAVGLLWTPPWWGWNNGVYVWHAGYWGPHVGFYGGINYGFGYSGHGYEGGFWNHGRFSTTARSTTSAMRVSPICITKRWSTTGR